MKKPVSLTAALWMLASGAMAGACPPDQVFTEPRGIGIAPGVDPERPLLDAVDPTGWRGMGSFHLRMRRLTVALHGIVPTHAHHDRPSIVLIRTGEMTGHSAFCAVPILHKAGDSTPEFGIGHKHRWENPTDRAVILISTDVVPVRMVDAPMMDMP